MKNLLIRTASGAVFIALFLAALLWHPAAFCAIFTAAVIIMMSEYHKITLGGKEKAARVISLFTGAAIFVGSFLFNGYGLDSKWLLAIPVMVSMIFFCILFCGDKDAYGNAVYTVSSIPYIAVPFAMTNWIVFGDNGFDGRILLAVMIVIWASDVGAYVFGISFGQKNGHKMCPSISPKKSWEGYFGGLFTAMAAGCAISLTGMTSIPWFHWIPLSLIINVASTLGDLAESQLKRNFGVKDSGKIMPGHGGLLDRFDGALTTFPAAVLYICLISA